MLKSDRHRPILSALARRGLRVADLARQCAVSVRTVYAWDAGRRRPADRHVATIAGLIGEEDARELYELTRDGPGRGRLPAAGSRRLASAIRATCAHLHAKGANDIALLVRAVCEAG